jgi:uncharacterized protein with HEPN domain
MPSDAEDGALRDILHHIDLARQFAAAGDFESFRGDTMRVYAVTRCWKSFRKHRGGCRTA